MDVNRQESESAWWTVWLAPQPEQIMAVEVMRQLTSADKVGSDYVTKWDHRVGAGIGRVVVVWSRGQHVLSIRESSSVK